jgi:hypothetical protein
MSSSIKSHIDWNELFPLLPRTLKDSMLLEAVQILSAGATRKRRSRRPPAGVDGNVANVLLPKTLRNWEEQGDRKVLAKPGRHYRIVSSKPPITKGAVKDIWDKLLEHKGDFVAYETILKTVKNDKTVATNNINYLWRTGRLEIAQGPNG